MVSYDVFTLLNTSESTEQPTNIARVRDLREANEYSLVQLNARFNPEETRLAIEIYNKVMKANYVNNPFRQQQRINEAIAKISPTKGAMAQGQVIIRRGDIITEEIANKNAVITKVSRIQRVEKCGAILASCTSDKDLIISFATLCSTAAEQRRRDLDRIFASLTSNRRRGDFLNTVLSDV